MGTELRLKKPVGVELAAFDRRALDITDREAVETAIGKVRPDVLINAAGYTAVDRAEQEPERAFAVNAEAARILAEACASAGVRLVHLSTDYVFDGAASQPYTPAHPCNPLSVYGQSKLEGEQRLLAAGTGAELILRTSWLYSGHGHNFVKTMLNLMRSHDEIRVVSDQIGSPTWAGSLADAVWRLAGTGEARGVLHWTDAGVASWYDFSVAIMEEALQAGLLPRPISVIPIGTEDYPTPARRPRYSVLDKQEAWSLLGERSPHWRASLRRMLQEHAAHGA